MKCSKCQTENSEYAKFCKGCGVKIEQSVIDSDKTELLNTELLKINSNSVLNRCAKCDAILKEGTLFCVQCGSKIATSSVPYNDISSPEIAKIKKPNPFLLFLPIIILVIAIIILLLIYQEVIPNPIKKIRSTVEQDNNINTSTSLEEIDMNVDELFIDIDNVYEEGKKIIEQDGNYFEGLVTLTSAFNSYGAIEYPENQISEATEHIQGLFTFYKQSTLEHVNSLEKQDVHPSIYNQIKLELENAIDAASTLNEKGIKLDDTELNDSLANLKERYKEYYIIALNKFTQRDHWSRSEAWQLMQDAKSLTLFDENDMDDPLRLRYVYSLAWITKKENETNLTNNSISYDIAISNILTVMKETDYNPMLILDCANYVQASGGDPSIYMDAFNEIFEHLKDTQGFELGTTINIDHFWYFNDFGDFSVDNKNGVTQENRQWIRDRFNSGF